MATSAHTINGGGGSISLGKEDGSLSSSPDPLSSLPGRGEPAWGLSPQGTEGNALGRLEKSDVAVLEQSGMQQCFSGTTQDFIVGDPR